MNIKINPLTKVLLKKIVKNPTWVELLLLSVQTFLRFP